MKKSHILEYLEANQDERGIAHWEKLAPQSGGLKSFGIGLTRLRKYAKTLGRDSVLAQELWSSDIYEMKIISILIDDPKLMTIDQAEIQVDQLEGGYLAHVYSTCGAPLAKAQFAIELADSWMNSSDEMRLRCGYGMLYEISKSKKKGAPDDNYFLTHIAGIDNKFSKQTIPVLMSMATALMGMGMRSKALNAAAIRVARSIGPIDFDPDGRCDPFDVIKHLTSDHAKKKLGL